MAKLRKKAVVSALARCDGRPSTTPTPPTSDEGQKSPPMRPTTSTARNSSDSKLPQPRSAKGTVVKPDSNASHYSKCHRAELGNGTTLPKPTNKVANPVTTTKRVQTCYRQKLTRKSRDGCSVKRPSASQLRKGTNAQSGGTNGEICAQSRNHTLFVSDPATSNAISAPGQALVATRTIRNLAVRNPSLTTKANGRQSPCSRQNATNTMTASELSEMYASCIARHPARTALPDTMIEPPGSPKSRRLVSNDHSIASRLPYVRGPVFELERERALYGNPDSARPACRQSFPKHFPQSSSKGPRRDPHTEHLSPGYPEVHYPVARRYETLDRDVKLPIHIKSATCPHIVESATMPIEALPSTSTQLSRKSLNKYSKGKRAATWSFLKSFASQTNSLSNKSFGWRDKSRRSQATKFDTQDRLRNARAQRDSLHDSRFGTDSPESITPLLTTKAPPRRPSRPKSLFSASEANVEPQLGETNPSNISSSTSTSTLAGEDEQARKAKHRRRAYFTLDGVTREHPTRNESSVESLKRMSERDMLVQRQVETRARPEPPTLTFTSTPKQSEDEANSPGPEQGAPASVATFCDHFDQPIISKHTSTRAWWENSPTQGSRFSNQTPTDESQLQGSESSSVKPKKNNLKGRTVSKGPVDKPGPATAQAHLDSPRAASQACQAERWHDNDVLARTIGKHREVHGLQAKNHHHHINQQSTDPVTSNTTNAHQRVMSIDHRRSPVSTTSDQSLDQIDNIHGSSSGSSLEAKATALRHGKALNGLNEYEAAHAIDSVPYALLSQCSLGLSEEQKNDMKPQPLRKLILTQSRGMTPNKPCGPEHECEDDNHAVTHQSRMRPSSHAAHPNGESSRHPKPRSPPPLPPRSDRRPRVYSDWTKRNTEDAKLDTLGDRNASNPQSYSLSRISEEEMQIILSDSETTAITAIRQPKSIAPRHGSQNSIASNPSTSSSSLKADDWWSSDDEHAKTPGGTQVSSQNTTPEKDAIRTGNNGAPATDEDKDHNDSYLLEREILQYYLDKQRRELDRCPKDRLRRELRRKAKVDEEARLLKQAEEQKTRLAEAVEEENRRVEQERVERIKSMLRALRGGESGDESL